MRASHFSHAIFASQFNLNLGNRNARMIKLIYLRTYIGNRYNFLLQTWVAPTDCGIRPIPGWETLNPSRMRSTLEHHEMFQYVDRRRRCFSSSAGQAIQTFGQYRHLHYKLWRVVHQTVPTPRTHHFDDGKLGTSHRLCDREIKCSD